MIIHLRVRRGLRSYVIGFRGEGLVSAVKASPRKWFPGWSLHRGNKTKRLFQLLHVVGFTAEIISLVKPTPWWSLHCRKSFPQWRLKFWNSFFCVISAVKPSPRKHTNLQISRPIRSYMKNRFSLEVRDPYGADSWKNRGSKISWHCPFKENVRPCIKKTHSQHGMYSTILRGHGR